MARSAYVYLIWAHPDYCPDDCCRWVAGVYTVKREMERDLGRVQAQDSEADINYYSERFKDGLL